MNRAGSSLSLMRRDGLDEVAGRAVFAARAREISFRAIESLDVPMSSLKLCEVFDFRE